MPCLCLQCNTDVVVVTVQLCGGQACLRAHSPQSLVMGLIAVFGYTVYSALRDPKFKELPRDLDCLELWSGLGHIACAATHQGLVAKAFDINRLPGTTDDSNSKDSEAILSENGFLNALSSVLRVQEHGLL